jgi:hypothetical protein
MRLYWFATVVFVTLGLFFTPADAQYIAPNTAGASGGACTNGTYAWPDSSGYFLKCVSGAWSKVTQAGTADYNAASCASPSFMAGLDPNGAIICRKPYIYTTFAGNTNNTTTATNKTYYDFLEGAMAPVNAASPAQGVDETTISRAGTLQNLQVHTDVANTAGKKVTYTIYVNGAGTDVSCYINGTSSCYDNGGIYSASAGDQVSVQIVTVTGDTTVRSSWSLEMAY